MRRHIENPPRGGDLRSPAAKRRAMGSPTSSPQGEGWERDIPFRASEMSANTQRMTSPLVGAQGYICHLPGVLFGHPGLTMTSALAGLGCAERTSFRALRASVARSELLSGPLRPRVYGMNFYPGPCGPWLCGADFFPTLAGLGWVALSLGRHIGLVGMCGAVRRSGGAAVIIGNPARSVGTA